VDNAPQGGQQANSEAASISTHISRRTLIYSSVVCFLAWVFCVYDYILFGTLLPVMAEDLGWTTARSTFVATLVSIGTFFIAIFVGPLLDYFGRKKALIFVTFGTAVSSFLTALTPQALAAVYLTIVRSISGLGYAEQAVNTTYLNELYGNRKNRGLIYSFVQGGWPVGVLIAAAFTAVLLPVVGWRWVFALATLPALVVVVLAFKLQESPRFLAMQRIRQMEKAGRHAEAVDFGQRFDIDVHHTEESTFRQLFEPDIRRHTLFLCAAMLMNWIGIQVFAVLGTTVLTEGKGVAFTSALTVLIVSNAAAYVGYITHGFMGDLITRRLTIAGGWIISGIAFTIMLFGPDASAFVLTMYTVGLFFIIGPYAALLFFMGESFPTRVRGTGASVVNAMGPLGAIVGSALLTALLSISGENMVFAAFLSGGIATILSGFLMFGTRTVRDPHEAEAIGGGGRVR
jgi:MFS family permease